MRQKVNIEPTGRGTDLSRFISLSFCQKVNRVRKPNSKSRQYARRDGDRCRTAVLAKKHQGFKFHWERLVLLPVFLLSTTRRETQKSCGIEIDNMVRGESDDLTWLGFDYHVGASRTVIDDVGQALLQPQSTGSVFGKRLIVQRNWARPSNASRLNNDHFSIIKWNKTLQLLF